jgi:hypothetical protein
LDFYAKISGLKVSLEKSELLVTAAEIEVVQNLTQIMGCKASNFPFKYLGMPLSNKKLQKEHYLPLIQKIQKKLPGWKASQLSIGGREILLNSTLTTIPIFFMSTFMLSKWVIREIDKIRRKFL